MQGVFVSTFLIGLREGLEAVLIVSIVATFLKRSGRSLRPMAVGVGAAVAETLARLEGALRRQLEGISLEDLVRGAKRIELASAPSDGDFVI